MRRPLSLVAIALMAAAPAAAQVALPPMVVPHVGQVVDPLLDRAQNLTGETLDEAARQAQVRLDRIDRLVRRNRQVIERDTAGEPARRGEIVLLDADAAQLATAQNAGYAVLESGSLDSLGMVFTRLSIPRGTDLGEAQRELAGLLPGVTIAPDNLYFPSGNGRQAVPQARPATRPGASRSAAVGMIDSAPGDFVPVAAIRGFATGAGQASDHGSAVASLLAGAGVRAIHVADVYGSDRAGGNAVAIARAIDWLLREQVQVVTISLVGPDNPVLARAIAGARTRGLVVVAAVGNNGPAAPPAYPASYPGVVAVTAVDRRERALIEAGRALHLDYAAPGADITGLDRRGRSQRLRGTSYATPLVAARIAQALVQGANWRRTLDAEAVDLGERGADATYGRGLVCRGCATAR